MAVRRESVAVGGNTYCRIWRPWASHLCLLSNVSEKDSEEEMKEGREHDGAEGVSATS